MMKIPAASFTPFHSSTVCGCNMQKTLRKISNKQIASFNIFKKLALKMFYKKGYTLNAFVRPRRSLISSLNSFFNKKTQMLMLTAAC